MSLTSRWTPWALPLLFGLLVGGCGGNDLTLPSDSVASKIVVVKGDAQSAVVGAVLPDSLTVRVTDSRDRPVEHQAVSFTVEAGGGTVTPASTLTNADGIAQARWILGPAAGAQSASARATGNGAAPNLNAAFAATGLTAAPAKLEKVAGDGQMATAGTAVATAPSVKVTDANGNPVAGVSVTFAVATGGGSVSPTTPVSTGASGLAAPTSWTLGPAAGSNTLTATVAGGVAGSPATFTATGTVGGANRLAFTVQPVNAAVGAPITPAVQVQVRDAGGNLVTTATNAISIALDNNPTGAALGGTTTVSAVNGTATFASLSLTKAGTGYTLKALASGLSSATSTAFDVVNASSTTTITNVSKGTTVVGEAYVVSFAVAATPPASGTPTGTVSVSDGTGATCSGSAPSGSCSLTSTTAGTKAVIATYGGDANFAGSASAATHHPVNPAATTATISNVAPSAPVFGQAVTVSYNVAVNAPGAGTPLGDVTVTYGSNGSLGSCTAPVTAGQCSFTPTSAANNQNLRATYAPSTGDFSGDQSGNVNLTVAKGSTEVTTLTSNHNPSNVLELVTFTATVAPVAPAVGAPTGNVVFKNGASTIGTGTLSGGQASVTTTFALPGSFSITAQYQGDGNFDQSPASTPLTQVVKVLNAAPTANDDPYNTNEDTQLNVSAPGVLGNDTDPNSDPLTAVLVAPPSHAASFSLNADGSFSYTPAANYNGPDAFTYRANDGQANSNTATVTITVNAVNDPPSFTKGPDQTVSISGQPGVQTVPNWATNISPGPSNEASQTVSFIVTTNDDAAFAPGGLPGIDPSGTLTYTPDPLAVGQAPVVTVTAQDNGGTVNGGQDTSAPQTFTITIGP